MHWKKHSDGLCIVGLGGAGGGIQQSYPNPRTVFTPRNPGRLSTLNNSQRLFITPTPTRKRSQTHPKSAPSSSLPDISRDRQQAEIGIHGTAKALHHNYTSPVDVVASTAAGACPEWVATYKMNSYESKSNKPERVSSSPRCFYTRETGQPALRTRSAAPSVTSLGDLSVTSVSLSLRSGSRRSGLDGGGSSTDLENPPNATDEKGTPQREKTERGSPRRSPGTVHSKLFRMSPSSLEQCESPSVQTIDLEKGNIQSFKKLLVLTHLPNTSKPGKSKTNSDPSITISDSPVTSLSSSSNESSSHRDRNMVMDLHQLSRQHASRRNSNPSAIDTQTLEPESGRTITEDRPSDKGMVNQWLVTCPAQVWNRPETDSMRRQIVLSVPSIEEEAET
ncbi:uncharacterized protein [Asterias amurensis]|uniref:uncharacterized protein n=1 Tax=Asterias amurensis TaxID=7602 RepID=UPI003AB78CEA